MHITLNRDDLLTGLSVAAKASPNNSTLTILTGILVETVGSSSLKFTATDLQLGIECIVDSTNHQLGRLVVPTKLMTDLVRKLPQGDVTLEFDTQEQSLKVKPLSTPKSEFSVKTYQSDEFPPFPELANSKIVEITNSSLRNLIKMTVFAASSEETRPFLTGVFTTLDESYLKMVATDSWRLSLAQTQLTISDDQSLDAAIIPARALSELSKLLPDNEELAKVSIDSNQASFISGGIKLVTRLIEGQFPNYKAILPKSHKATVSVNRSTLLGAAERASLMVREKISLVRITNTPECLVVTSNAPDMGKGYEEIPISQEGEEIRVVVDSRYLIEALKAMTSDEIVIKLQGPLQAVCLYETDNPDFVHLIMPVKVPA